MFESVLHTQQRLESADYIADEALCTTLYLSIKMRRPLFLEGAPGVGKTEIARVLSKLSGAPLIRLQCYEGLDVHHALYEWNYPRQLLTLQASGRATGPQAPPLEELYTEDFLLKRPLLQAIDAAHEAPPVLLIDEIDRADEEFESFLLELLGDFQVTIPELGRLEAEHRPYVVLTSNRTREVHDALKRRCLYAWIDHPDLEKELRIVRRKIPALSERLASSVVEVVQALRRQDLQKPPGVAESLDWADALVHLGVEELDPRSALATSGALLKHRDDLALFARWLEAREGARAG